MSKYTGNIGVIGENPFTTNDDNPTHDLGAVMAADGNRRFVYVLNGGTAMVRGSMYQAPAEDTADQDITPTATAIGATSITTSSTMTVTANQYAGGFIVVTVTPGVGQVFKIKSHAAYTAAAATFVLEDPVQVALTTTSRIDFVANPYNGVVITPATLTGVPVGVAVNTISAGNYGWLQTWGPAPVIADAGGAITVDDALSTSNQTSGTVEVGVAGQPNIGYALSGIAANETGLAFLRIA